MLSRRSDSRVPRLRDWSVNRKGFCGQPFFFFIPASLFSVRAARSRGTGMANLQTSRALMVLSSSPTRRRGSILNSAPSSSPTPISWPDGGSMGGALDTRAAKPVLAENGRTLAAAAKARGAAAVRRRMDRSADMFLCCCTLCVRMAARESFDCMCRMALRIERLAAWFGRFRPRSLQS